MEEQNQKSHIARTEEPANGLSRAARIKRFVIGKIWVLKAVAVSQVSAWVDFGMSFLSFALLHLASSYAAAVGAVCGGIVNCALNYKWTFRSSGTPVFNVAVKYAMVWFGSLTLNSVGTGAATYLLSSWSLMDMLGVSMNLRFTIARLLVSLIVSVFWNLLLQRCFVYRTVRFDAYLSRIRIRHT